jgi:hypothetical protein
VRLVKDKTDVATKVKGKNTGSYVYRFKRQVGAQMVPTTLHRDTDGAHIDIIPPRIKKYIALFLNHNLGSLFYINALKIFKSEMSAFFHGNNPLIANALITECDFHKKKKLNTITMKTLCIWYRVR